MLDWETMLGNSSYRLDTGYGVDSKSINFYKAVVKGKDATDHDLYETYFTGLSELFAFATLLGYFSQRKSDVKQVNKFARAQQLDQETRGAEITSALKMIWLEIIKLPENENKSQMELWTEFCRYSDGGIEILLEQWENNNFKLDLTRIYQELLPKMDKFVEKITADNEE
jgi:hypothetical protein